MAHAIAMLHDVDPKQSILNDVGNRLDNVRMLGSRILVGVYIRPNMTKGGIQLTSKTVEEDRFQGKVGLILAKGPIAFSEDDRHRFGGVEPAVGDWVVFNIGDTFAFDLGERRCRSIEDVDIHMILPSPDAIW